MPRFYFDLYDGENFAPDPQGVDLPSADIAKQEATRTLSEIAAQEIPVNGSRRLFRIVVLDESRTIVSEARIDFHTTLPENTGKSPGDRGELDDL